MTAKVMAPADTRDMRMRADSAHQAAAAARKYLGLARCGDPRSLNNSRIGPACRRAEETLRTPTQGLRPISCPRRAQIIQHGRPEKISFYTKAIEKNPGAQKLPENVLLNLGASMACLKIHAENRHIRKELQLPLILLVTAHDFAKGHPRDTASGSPATG